MYLKNILEEYRSKDLATFKNEIGNLANILKQWASSCFIELLDSGSYAKGTAISLASDLDYLISLKYGCSQNKGGIEYIYQNLLDKLADHYDVVRKQNVSVGITIGNCLKIDVTPATKHFGNTNDHWIYLSKLKMKKQTNISKHISEISKSGRTKEIRLLKIWRELNKLDFPSIYLEYLLINHILIGKPKNEERLNSNFWHIFGALSQYDDNPLFLRVVDPSNSNNILSDLLNRSEKQRIILQARIALSKTHSSQIIY